MSDAAAAPDPGAAAARMSARHPWLAFTAGPPLPLRPDVDPGDWQRSLSALHARWYDGVAPPAVAAVFVLQWVLQVPAHTAAYAAATGPVRARLDGLTFSRGPALVPDAVALDGLVPDDGDLAARLDRAEDDYRSLAEPLARDYPSPVRLGPRARSALVHDMWVAARRDAETVVGIVRPGVPARASCCLIYALPDCGECAGCPRLGPSGTRRPVGG